VSETKLGLLECDEDLLFSSDLDFFDLRDTSSVWSRSSFLLLEVLCFLFSSFLCSDAFCFSTLSVFFLGETRSGTSIFRVAVFCGEIFFCGEFFFGSDWLVDFREGI